jgi:hypothetical protein
MELCLKITTQILTGISKIDVYHYSSTQRPGPELQYILDMNIESYIIIPTIWHTLKMGNGTQR